MQIPLEIGNLFFDQWDSDGCEVVWRYRNYIVPTRIECGMGQNGYRGRTVDQDDIIVRLDIVEESLKTSLLASRIAVDKAEVEK